MKLYEIDRAIDEFFTNNIDPETGEMTNLDQLDALQMAREDKLESIGIALKNARADVEALKAEKDNISKRIAQAQRVVDSIENYYAFALGGEKFKTSKVSVSYRESDSVVIDDLDRIPEKYIKVETTFTPIKADIKKAIKGGQDIDGCHLEKKNNMIVR